MDAADSSLDYYAEETLSVEMLQALYPLVSSKIEEIDDFNKMFAGIINIVLSDYCLDDRIIDWRDMPYSGHAVFWLKVFSQPSSLTLQEFKLHFMKRIQTYFIGDYNEKPANSENTGNHSDIAQHLDTERLEASTQTEDLNPDKEAVTNPNIDNLSDHTRIQTFHTDFVCSTSLKDFTSQACSTESASITHASEETCDEKVGDTLLSLSNLDDPSDETIPCSVLSKPQTFEDISSRVKQEIVDETYNASISTSYNTESATSADNAIRKSLAIDQPLQDQVTTVMRQERDMGLEEDAMPGIGLVTSVSVKAEPMEFESSVDFSVSAELTGTDEMLIPHDNELDALMLTDTQPCDVADSEPSVTVEKNDFDFYCHSCRDFHAYYSSKSRYRYVCWLKDSGQCKYRYMTCRMTKFVKHKKSAHPTGTIFENDQATIKKKQSKARKLHDKEVRKSINEYPHTGESVGAEASADGESSELSSNSAGMYYCCSCEFAHSFSSLPRRRCFVDSVPCIYTYESCDKKSLVKHQTDYHPGESCYSVIESSKPAHTKQSENEVTRCLYCRKSLEKHHEESFVCSVESCPYGFRACTVERMRAHHNILHSKEAFRIVCLVDKQGLEKILSKNRNVVYKSSAGSSKSVLSKLKKKQETGKHSEVVCAHCHKDLRKYHDERYICCIQKCKDIFRSCTVALMTEHHSTAHADRPFKISKVPMSTMKAERQRYAESLLSSPSGFIGMEQKVVDFGHSGSGNALVHTSMFSMSEGEEHTSFKCTHCEYTCPSKPELNDHISTGHPDVKPSMCEDCNQVLGTKHKANFRCSWEGCGFNSCSENVLNIHKNISCHRDRDNKTNKTTTDSIEEGETEQPPLQDDFIDILDAVNTPHVSQSGIRIYKPTHLEKMDGRYKCPVCNYRSTTAHARSSLNAHIAKRHMSDKADIWLDHTLFDCETCGQKLDEEHQQYVCACHTSRKDGYCQLNDYVQHVRNAHPNWTVKFTYSCPFCSETVFGEGVNALVPHLAAHGPRCLVCNEIRTKDHMYGHAYNFKDDKSLVICSNRMISDFEIKQGCQTIQAKVNNEPNENIESVTNETESAPRDTNESEETAEISAVSTEDGEDGSSISISYELDPAQYIKVKATPPARRPRGRPRGSKKPVLTGLKLKKSASVVAPITFSYNLKDPSIPYQCYFCKYVTVNVDDIFSHVTDVHVEKKNYTCKLCTSYRASRKANWTHHMVSIHKICAHKSDDRLRHTTDGCQMPYITKVGDPSSCTQCSLKRSVEAQMNSKRKGGKEHKPTGISDRGAAKRVKRGEEQRIVTGGVKGSRESNDELIIKVEEAPEVEDNSMSGDNTEATMSEAETESAVESEYEESSESEQYDDDHASDEDYYPEAQKFKSKFSKDGKMQISAQWRPGEPSPLPAVMPNSTVTMKTADGNTLMLSREDFQLVNRNGVIYAVLKQNLYPKDNSVPKPVVSVSSPGQTLLHPKAKSILSKLSPKNLVSKPEPSAMRMAIKPEPSAMRMAIKPEASAMMLIRKPGSTTTNQASTSGPAVSIIDIVREPEPSVTNVVSISKPSVPNVVSTLGTIPTTVAQSEIFAAANFSIETASGVVGRIARNVTLPPHITAPRSLPTSTNNLLCYKGSTGIRVYMPATGVKELPLQPKIMRSLKRSVPEEAPTNVYIHPQTIAKSTSTNIVKSNAKTIPIKIVQNSLVGPVTTKTTTTSTGPVSSFSNSMKTVSMSPPTRSPCSSGLQAAAQFARYSVVAGNYEVKVAVSASSGVNLKHAITLRCNTCYDTLVGYNMHTMVETHNKTCKSVVCESLPNPVGTMKDTRLRKELAAKPVKSKPGVIIKNEIIEAIVPTTVHDPNQAKSTNLEEVDEHDGVAITNEPILELN